MDKFVIKGEKKKCGSAVKEHIQTRIVAASAVKRVLDFRLCPTTHLKMLRQNEIVNSVNK